MDDDISDAEPAFKTTGPSGRASSPKKKSPVVTKAEVERAKRLSNLRWEIHQMFKRDTSAFDDFDGGL